MKIENIEGQIREAERQAHIKSGREILEMMLYEADRITRMGYKPMLYVSASVFCEIALAFGGEILRNKEAGRPNTIYGYRMEIVPWKDLAVVGINVLDRETQL